VKYDRPHLRGVEIRVLPPKQMSTRIPLLVAVASVSACALLWLGCGVYLYWNDPRLLNFLAAWIPFVLSLLLAFVPEHKMNTTNKILWRSGVIGLGFVWSVVLWHQQVITDKAAREDRERIVTTAVNQSNQHSDQQIGAVRTDVQGVKNDVQGVKKDLEDKLSDTISKSTSTLSESIGKVNKPESQELARLQFSLMTEEADQNPSLLPIRQTILPLVGDVVTIKLSTTAVGKSPARNGIFLLRICDACTYVEEPTNSSAPNGDRSSSDRRMSFQQIYPGAWIDNVILKLRVTGNYQSFMIGCMYTCENCESGHTQATGAQILQVFLTR